MDKQELDQASSRVVVCIWDPDSLQVLGDAAAKHCPDLARCATIKREFCTRENACSGIEKGSCLIFEAPRRADIAGLLHAKVAAQTWRLRKVCYNSADHVLLERTELEEDELGFLEKRVLEMTSMQPSLCSRNIEPD